MDEKKLKIGGGGHLQYYDLSNGQYCDDDFEKLNDNDLKNITLYYYYNLKQYNIFHYPINPIHGNDYANLFIQFIKYYKLYEKPYIEKDKINKYIFVKQIKNDKSKFVIEVLGYKNDLSGWKEFEEDLIKGTDFTKMKYDPPLEHVLKVITITTIKNKEDKKIKFYTIWELTPNLNLRFITILPRRITND